MKDVKFVADRMVVGPHGQYVIESGYTEIAGVRFYPDRLVVGPYGQPTMARGSTEIARVRGMPKPRRGSVAAR
jgi:hypothetical protein